MKRNIKEFRNTMTVTAFRSSLGIDVAAANAEKVRIIETKNPEDVITEGPAAGSKRCYFAVKTPGGNVLGSVSHKYYTKELTKPVVSKTVTNDGLEGFLLHQEGELPEAVAMFE